jgi:7-carboxy-7-deazaguanine synthase
MRVSEIFTSIQGESSYAGWPCTFVRLAGCNLDCAWCDTAYAREERQGEELAPAAVRERVAAAGLPLVCLTGGEPLCQPEAPSLAAALAAEGRTVLVETNGSRDIDLLPPPVVRVVDLKPPSSGMTERMDERNLRRLRPGDELKIVVADRADYDWARRRLERFGPERTATVLLSPVLDRLSPATLAAWILADRLPVRLQVQLHRLVWPDRLRGV